MPFPSTTDSDICRKGEWFSRHYLLVSPTKVSFPIVYENGLFYHSVLVNTHHVKQVPGRKTDVKDCQWIAELLQHGLLKPSFVPPEPVRRLRELTRQRMQAVRAKASVANRIQKVLEDANIKIGCVASDVLGKSGRAILWAIARGEEDPVLLAEMAQGRLRARCPTDGN